MPEIDPLAAYAAGLASVTFIWRVVDDYRSRSRRLKVSAYIGTVYVPTGITQPNYQRAGRYVTFKAQNAGPLDVQVQSCGLAKTKLRLGGRRVIAQKQLTLPENFHFPQEIPVGRHVDAIAKLETFVGDSAPSDWDGYDRPYFDDAVGKTHLGPVERELLRELREASSGP